MLRKVLVVIGVLLIGVTAAAAQSCDDSINTRQTLMKKSGAAAKTASAMVKGDEPFDLAKAKQVFATFADDVSQMPNLFPDCSKAGDHTTAAPQIWDRRDDFNAAIAQFASDIKAAQENTKDLDTFKASFQAVGKNCSSCHQAFRVRPS